MRVFCVFWFFREPIDYDFKSFFMLFEFKLLS